jgi:hypothetical protein
MPGGPFCSDYTRKPPVVINLRAMGLAQCPLWSKADMTASNLDVHFAPESGHLFSLSGIGAGHSALPRGSDFYLFGDAEGIINLNAKVAHRALNLAVGKQELHRSRTALRYIKAWFANFDMYLG